MDESYVQGIRLMEAARISRAELTGRPGQRNGSSLAIRPEASPASTGGPERLAYSVDEAAAVLGIARETIYELIRTGQLRSRKAGSRRIIGRHHLLEFLDGSESLADRPAG
jgi:excisionase family DNA binding protein